MAPLVLRHEHRAADRNTTGVARQGCPALRAKVGDATATTVRSTSGTKAVIVTANMPAAPVGKVYELWLQQGSAMVKAGFAPLGPTNTVVLHSDAATAAGVDVTVEPAGGSDTPALPLPLIRFA